MDLKTVGYLTERLGVNPPQAYALIRNDVIKAPVVVRVGRQYRINPDELDLWIAEGGAAYSQGWRKTKVLETRP